MTTLNFALARAMARDWREGDEVVVTEMDHRANVDPWISAIEDKGGTVRWIRVDRERLTLDLSDLTSIIGPKTKLVAVGLASNVIGTINDVRTIADAAHSVGAYVVVDAVRAPHLQGVWSRCNLFSELWSLWGLSVSRLTTGFRPKVLPSPENVLTKSNGH